MSRFTPYWSDVGRYADPMDIGCSCGIGKRREGTGAALKLLGDACVCLIRYIRRWVEGPSFPGPDAMYEKEISGVGMMPRRSHALSLCKRAEGVASCATVGVSVFFPNGSWCRCG